MKSILITCVLIMTAFSLNAQTWPLSDYSISALGGSELTNGLAGGLNAAQFYDVDVNRDGTKDLIVFDRDGSKLMVYEAIPDGDCVSYQLNDELANYFPLMDQFVIPKDYTRDGVPDLFTFSQIGIDGMQVYRGIDMGDHLEFELVVLDQNFANVLAYRLGNQFINVPVSRIDLPAIADIDGDGDLDILTFPSNGGSLNLYHNLQVEEDLDFDEILFELADNCWGKFYESDNSEEIFLADNTGACARPGIAGGAQQRHNGSTTLVWDPNRDGLPDVLIGDFTSDQLVHLQNGGVLGSALMTSQDFRFPAYDQSAVLSTFLASFHLDVDCDNKKDILVSPNITNGSAKTNNVLFYKNIGVNQDSFKFLSNDFLANTILDYGRKSSPATVDINGDGWMDIVIGVAQDENNTVPVDARLVVLLNNADGSNPGFAVSDEDYLGLTIFSEGSRMFAPAFGDMDSDGDMDIVVGDESGFLIYGENIAGPDQPIDIPTVQYGWQGIDTRNIAVPTIADVNRDGLLDLVIGVRNLENDPNTNMPCGNLNYYQNVGSASSPSFMTNPATAPNSRCIGKVNENYFNTSSVYASPYLYDTGDSLILISGIENGTISRYKVGAVDETWQRIDSFIGGLDEGIISKPVLADLNNDEILELIVGNQRGGFSIYTSTIKTNGELISSTMEPPVQLDYSIYPNPIGPGMQLNMNMPWSAYDVHLFDLQGKRVFQTSVFSESSSIDLPTIPAGIYFMTVFAEASSISEKLIIFN